MIRKAYILPLLIFIFNMSTWEIVAQTSRYEGRFADNLDGTFTNPVILADYPDPDIIRVGHDFYMVSSSFTTVPGIPILHSQDLINWKTIGYAYDRLPQNPGYDMQENKVMYRGGSWAPCIRYHKGMYYICFCTPSEGFFVCRSNKPEGPYEMTSFGTELYDPSMLFDDDGRIYIAHGANTIYITELTEDARSIKKAPQVVYSSSFGTPYEGSHIYKRKGWYYICNTTRGYNGIQVCMRSKNIYGPYETKLLSGDDMNYSGCGLHQGGFVELENGETWFFTFQDRDYIGRVPVLQPVTWKDEWPLFGDPQNYMKAQVTCRKPSVKHHSKPSLPLGSDNFEKSTLGLQWQWNHNPDNTLWSLKENPGHLRIYASTSKDILHARNTLTTKILGNASIGTIKINTRHMKSGDVAGITMFNIPYAWLGIVKEDSIQRIAMCNNGTIIDTSEPINGNIFYLRAQVTEDGETIFSHSTDNEKYTVLGEPFIMQFTVKTFLGNRYGLFCFHSGNGKGGYCDFDEFILNSEYGPANHHPAEKEISFCAYDDQRAPDKSRKTEKRPHQYLFRLRNNQFVTFNHICFNRPSQSVTLKANIQTGGIIEIREKTPQGKLIAECRLQPSQNHILSDSYQTYSFPLFESITGDKSLCFIFKGGNEPLFHLDWFRFNYE
ncbi:family 43 glycosylhydrolase [Bacteroides finegoldii]|uniref:family 43 glycosylhydrolase n=1 Tax=Bacteroides finegoldii TaxID=338188 RepID=UPI0018A0DF8B|nr:family 43 glycosylhydrolase [Bacteroides finegoldii]